jgi:hypothetical protein
LKLSANYVLADVNATAGGCVNIMHGQSHACPFREFPHRASHQSLESHTNINRRTNPLGDNNLACRGYVSKI